MENVESKQITRIVMTPTSTGFEDTPIEYKVFYSITQNQDSYLSRLEKRSLIEWFYKALYMEIGRSLRSSHYFKQRINYEEVVFLGQDWFKNKTKNIAENFSQMLEYAADPQNIMAKNENFKDEEADLISKLNIFDISSDIRYKHCNVFPHYINLDYMLINLEDMYKQLICDTNMTDVPDDLLKEILCISTIRVHVTDLMIKIIPFLNLLDTKDLNEFNKESFCINVIKEHIKKEMFIFHSNYFYDFNKMINELYSKEEYFKKLKPEIFLQFSSEEHKFLEYYISKEIKRFIIFCLEKQIIKPRTTSLYKKREGEERYLIKDNIVLYTDRNLQKDMLLFLDRLMLPC